MDTYHESVLQSNGEKVEHERRLPETVSSQILHSHLWTAVSKPSELAHSGCFSTHIICPPFHVKWNMRTDLDGIPVNRKDIKSRHKGDHLV